MEESPVLFYQQYVYYEDGSEDIIVSDLSWKVSDGPIVFDEIFMMGNDMMHVLKKMDGICLIMLTKTGQMPAK